MGDRIMSPKRIAILVITLIAMVMALLIAMSHAMAAATAVDAAPTPSTLAVFELWLQKWAPYVLGSLLPSIAVGLMSSPKTEEAGALLTKAISF